MVGMGVVLDAADDLRLKALHTQAGDADIVSGRYLSFRWHAGYYNAEAFREQVYNCWVTR